MAGSKGMKSELSNVSTTFVAHNAFLKKFVARYFSNQQDIEDVVQEAYLRAYAAERERDIEQPKAFLFRIAKNVALTKLTKKSRQITDYLEEATAAAVVETAAPADQEASAHELLGLYCDAVVAMPDKCREVFCLRKINGLSHKEIAARMSLSVSSVEKYLRQGILACDAYIDDREASEKIRT